MLDLLKTERAFLVVWQPRNDGTIPFRSDHRNPDAMEICNLDLLPD